MLVCKKNRYAWSVRSHIVFSEILMFFASRALKFVDGPFERPVLKSFGHHLPRLKGMEMLQILVPEQVPGKCFGFVVFGFWL